MLIKVLKGKLHRGTVTDSKLHYPGSVAIDPVLTEAAGITTYETVLIADLNNGNRLETYVVPDTITAGTPVRTDADFTYVTANLIYDIIPTDAVEIGLGLGGGLVDYDLAFQSEVSPLRVATESTLPFAFPMFRIAKAFGRFGLLGTIGGIAVNFSGNDISYLQADLSASYRIFGEDEKLQGHVTLGYQYFRVDYEYGDQGGTTIINVTLEGPYFGFLLSF